MSIFLKPLFKKLKKQWGLNDERRLKKLMLPDGIVSVTDIPYTSSGLSAHLLDIFYPEKPSCPLPVIIEIHGGGFFYGNKERSRPYCCQLAKRGFIVCSVNYRLTLDNADITCQLRDIAEAVKFLTVKLKEFPADTDNFFITGDSAGAYLALMTALISKNEPLQKKFGTVALDLNFKAVSLICGLLFLYDKSLPYWAIRRISLEKGYKKKPYYADLDINNLIKKYAFPPAYIASSRQDGLRHMTLGFEKLSLSYALPYKMDYLKKERGKKLGHIFCIDYPEKDESRLIIDNMVNFFKSRIDR